MANHLKALFEKRNQLFEEGKQITDLASKEGRALTEEENTRHAAIIDEATKLNGTIEATRKQESLQKAIEADLSDAERGVKKGKDGEVSERDAFRAYLARGADGLADAELRVLQQANNPEGGYLVPLEQFVASILKFVDDAVHIRTKATVFGLTGAQSLGVPTLETDPSDPDWTSELGSVQQDTAMRFGKRELKPNLLTKEIAVSNKLLANSAVPVDTFVLSRLAYKFAVAQEKNFIIGNGSDRPLGFMVESDQGVPAARSIATGNGTSAPTIDGLLNCKYSVKSQYMAAGEWIFHRDTIKEIAKLKSAVDGQYYWQPSKQMGEPDMLLGNRVTMSEFMPNTLTTGQLVGAFADFRYYYIAEMRGMEMQRLVELAARNNQTLFIGRMYVDGMPALAEAFARVKLG